jgi:hypothetical protein
LLVLEEKDNNVTVLRFFFFTFYPIQDPFFMNARPRGKGTKEDPNVVDAMATYRLVGCSCNDEDTNLKWMWVFEGKPKRCACGYWFELKVHEGPDKYKLPA